MVEYLQTDSWTCQAPVAWDELRCFHTHVRTHADTHTHGGWQGKRSNWTNINSYLQRSQLCEAIMQIQDCILPKAQRQQHLFTYLWVSNVVWQARIHPPQLTGNSEMASGRVFSSFLSRRCNHNRGRRFRWKWPRSVLRNNYNWNGVEEIPRVKEILLVKSKRPNLTMHEWIINSPTQPNCEERGCESRFQRGPCQGPSVPSA